MQNHSIISHFPNPRQEPLTQYSSVPTTEYDELLRTAHIYDLMCAWMKHNIPEAPLNVREGDVGGELAMMLMSELLELRKQTSDTRAEPIVLHMKKGIGESADRNCKIWNGAINFSVAQ